MKGVKLGKLQSGKEFIPRFGASDSTSVARFCSDEPYNDENKGWLAARELII